MSKLGMWVERLFKEHKFMRRFTMFWSMWVITYVVIYRPEMGGVQFTVIGGLLATSIGLYQWDKMLGK